LGFKDGYVFFINLIKMKKNDHIFKVLRVPGFFFSPQFCDVAEVVVIHFGDLARFGYMLDMKAEKKQNPSIFLATYWNSSLKSGDLDFLFLEIWLIWGISYMQNPLYMSKSYFSGHNLLKFQGDFLKF